MKAKTHAGLLILIALAMVGCNKPGGDADSKAKSAEVKAENKTGVGEGAGHQSAEQGWDAATREKAWFTSFGSRLMPYRWMEVLERAGSEQRFADIRHLTELGFLPAAKSALNPAGFPVGFTPVTDSKGEQWVGLGCAACHTAEVHHQGKALRIDGGPALLDFTGFERELIRALSATLADADKFDRFARANGASGKARLDLQNRLTAMTQKLDARHRTNATEVAYGHGRLDAFGQIFNAVAVDALGIPENVRAPDAPVSFPALWSAPHLDVVQWNGSAPNAGPGPLFQNVTTALAVYGLVDVHSTSPLRGYPSSVNFTALGEIQERVYQLKSPQWPALWFGAIDQAKSARGAGTYAKACALCHALSNREDGKRQLKATLVKLPEIGTDPRMVENFLNGKVKTGVFKGRKQAVVAGPKFADEARSIDVVVHASMGTVLRHPLKAIQDAAVGYHKVIKAAIDTHPNYYKARPLDGIWASAPYLHNGSVPSLRDMLKPETERPARFVVGNREYDPVNVGYVSKWDGGVELNRALSEFDTQKPGNSNRGHRYGSELSEAEKSDLLEYLKSL